MSDGHLGQAAHEKQRNHGSDEVAEKHSWSCKPDGKPGAKKESCTDGSADRNHGQLAS